ncbi:hypothetical protein BTH82_08740, partial [Lactobacillus delbrueckii subsp. bulgaricus]|nr:hypothetical protein [Lactobacillus delbrueckii subsp. bulgaricus]MBT8873755.1 hypothetical protein [Lactobacillus delbrueckii subsp. bulgaricus]
TRLQKSTLTPNLTAFTGVDSQNLPDVMVSVQFILAIGGRNILTAIFSKLLVKISRLMKKSGEHGKIFKN